MDPTSLLSAIAHHVASTRASGAMATVIATSGSVPQKPGARIAVFDDGKTLGTVGGGAIEHHVVRVLEEAVITGVTDRWATHLTRQLGMCCGGQMEFFVEPLAPSPRLVLFGAGHIAKPCAAIAHASGFSCCVVDDRAQLNTKERFPECQRIVDDGDEALKRADLVLGPHDYVVICTHSHRLDQEILKRCASLPRALLGMVASRRKAQMICNRLRQQDRNIDLSDLRSPVGLNIGAIEPAEIAISIVAQLVEARRRAAKKEKVLGVVLAAGASSRMGLPKALLELDQGTVLERIINTLEVGGCDEVCAVVAKPHEANIRAAHPSLSCETNAHPKGGMLGSVICGLRAARERGATRVVFALLDQPRVSPGTVRMLVGEAQRSSARYVVPQYGHRRGHPFVLDAALELTSPQQGATLRDVLRGVDQLSVVDVDDPFILDDLDTPEDAARLGISSAELSAEDSDSA